MLARKKTALFSMDADGTLYGNVYKVMLLTLALEYGNEFIRLAALDSNHYDDADNEYLRSALVTMHEYIDDPATPDACMMVSRKHDTQEALLRHSFISALKKLAPEVYAKVLYVANRELIAKLLNEANNLDHLFLAIGSLRQTEELDQYNMLVRGTGSIFEDIFILEAIFKSKLPRRVLVEVFPFTMMDAMTNQAVGSGLTAIFEGAGRVCAYQSESSKLPIHYALIHGACLLLDNRGLADFHLAYYFIDDVEDLHQQALQTFSSNRHLLPQQASFFCGHVVNGNMRRKYIGNDYALQGTGCIDGLFLVSAQSLHMQLAHCQRALAMQGLLLSQEYIDKVVEDFNFYRFVPERRLFFSNNSAVSDNRLERRLSFL